MKIKLILTLSAAIALIAGGAASASGDATAAACKPGMTTYQGVHARVYCGTASAIVKLGGRTLTYRGGSCLRNGVAVELGIGMVILDVKDPKTLPRSFGISVGRVLGIGKPAPKDGTYDSALVALVEGGKRYAGGGKATLTHNRSRGTFTAKTFGGDTVTGSFRCS